MDEVEFNLRVLHLVKTSVGATWALRQMAELKKLGVDVHVAIPTDGHLIDDYEAHGIEVHPWRSIIGNGRGLGRYIGAVQELGEICAELKPDLIHSHFVLTTVLCRLVPAARWGGPRIFQVPGPLHLEHPVTADFEVNLAGERDYWLASCEYTRRRYLELGISGRRVFLSYYGLYPEEFETDRTGELRSELGVEACQPLVGMVAFMYPPKRYLGQSRGIKGHEDFLEAVAMAAGEVSDLRAVVIGGAWGGASDYERRVREYGREVCGDRVAFLGSRADVPKMYPDLDLAVHPSHSENVGGACESLLAEVPTIATEVGGFPDMVIQGQTGRLVPPKDPRELARAMVSALRSPSEFKAMAKRGRIRVERTMDVRITAREVLDCYISVLSGLPGPSARRQEPVLVAAQNLGGMSSPCPDHVSGADRGRARE